MLITNQLKEMDKSLIPQRVLYEGMKKQSVFDNDTVHYDDCFTNHSAVVRCV